MSTAQSQNAPQGSPLVKPGAPLWLVTLLAASAQLMIVLDERVVNVALPSMRADLGLTTGEMQWVITGYLVTFGGLLLLAARSNDVLGRRRMLIVGLVVFTLASAWGGVSSTGFELVAARVLQGVGAAILAPASLALITLTHLDPTRRRRAIGVWGTVTAVGAVAGVVLGGVLTSTLGWRSVMFVNIPVGVALLAITVFVLVPSSKLPRAGGGIDVAGALAVTVGSGALVYGVSEAPANGWLSAPVLVALVLAVVAIIAFVIIEGKVASPILALSLFRVPNLLTANLGLVAFGAVLTLALYFLSLYLQDIGGYTPLETGLALVPMSLLLGAGSILTPRLIAAGVRGLPIYGSVLAAVGLVWLAFAPSSGAFTAILAPTLLIGAGFGVLFVPLAGAATSGVEPQRAGTASGLLNVSRQLGGAVGLAVVVSVIAAIAPAGAAGSGALSGYHLGFAIAAALSLVTAVIVSRLGVRSARGHGVS
jgi:EmrB/QacA subfamily drug resistance transporter